MKINFVQKKKGQLALRLKRVIARDQFEGTFDTVRSYIKYGDFWWRCVAMPNYRED